MIDRDMRASLRAADYERYVCALMQPARGQLRLFTLLAFNAELGTAAEAASEPAVGAIRLKWWQEALEKGDTESHPFLPHLQCFEPAELQPLIEARMMELEHRGGFDDMAQFDGYLRHSAGALHQLLLQEKSDVIADAGAFYALVGLLRAMPYHLERGMVRFPKDILKRYGISPAALEAGVEKEAFAHFMAFWLEELQRRAEALAPSIKAAPCLIRRLHVCALLYARALIKADGHPTKVPRRLPNLPLRIWFHGKRGLYTLS